MSGKRSVPSLWASRGAMFAAVSAVALVVWAVVGAWMLFAPQPQRPAATPVAPPTTAEDVVPAEDVEPEPTFEDMAAPNTDWGSVRTIAPKRAKPPEAVAHPPQDVDAEPADEPTATVPTGGDGDRDGGGGDGDGDGDGTGDGDGGGDGGGETDEPVDDHPGRGNGPKDPPGRR